MDIRKLQRAIVDGLEDVKGQNIVVFNTEHLSPLFERVIIASGTSNRQTRALAASVREAVKAKGFGLSRTEGEDNGEWIIVDCGAAVVHLMQPNIREYYHLEEIWGDKPVRLKLDGTPARLVKASESAPAPPAKAAAPAKPAAKRPVPAKTAGTGESAKKAAAKKAGAKKAGAKKAGAKKAVAPVGRRGVAIDAPAKRAAPRKTVTRSVGVKSRTAGTAAPKASAKRSAASKAVRRKA